MNKHAILLIVIAVWVPIALYAAVRWWKRLDSPDGERYLKRRMQGPFVPLSPEEIAEDEARRAR